MTRQGALTTQAKPAGEDTVFIVDDDADMSQSLASLLRSLDYRVEAFTTAQGFLERMTARLVGCVLLDVRLPAISGMEIQRRLAEANQSIPIIFLTGHGDIQMAVSAMKAGAFEFLSKPFRDQQLIDAVAAAMAQARYADEQYHIRAAYLQEVARLSPKEREVLDDLASGLQIKEIATKRALSTSTIRIHRRNIRLKVKSTNLNRFMVLHNKYRSES